MSIFLQLAAGFGAVIVALPVLLLVAEALRRGRDRRAFPPPGALVDVGGRKLHLRTLGQGPITVVLVTGGGGPAAFLFPLQERISTFARVCTYDRAGFGWSDRIGRALSFDDQARELHTLLASAGEKGPFVLVGESFGGLIVRAFAPLFADEVAGVMLIDAAEEEHTFTNVGLLLASVRRQLASIRILAPLGIVRSMARRTAPKLFTGRDRERIVALLARESHWVAAAQEVGAYELTPAARRGPGGFGGLGDKPLVVLAHDKPFRGAYAALETGWRAGQERLAALSSRGRLVVATGSGHTIAQEDPDLVVAELERLMAELGAA